MSGSSENVGMDGEELRFGCPWSSTPPLPFGRGEQEEREEQKGRLRALVAELRTTDKPQTTAWLHRIGGAEAGMCCLGVACYVAIDGGLQLRVEQAGNLVNFGAAGERAMLPAEAQRWFGLEENPLLHLTDTAWRHWKALERPSEAIQELLKPLKEGWAPAARPATNLNDELQLPFAVIADCFEYTYLREDWEQRLAASQD